MARLAVSRDAVIDVKGTTWQLEGGDLRVGCKGSMVNLNRSLVAMPKRRNTGSISNCRFRGGVVRRHAGSQREKWP